jgi:uncharacterized protein
MSSEAPPCLSCGACCFSRLDTYVRVSGDDHTRLNDDNLSVFIGNRCYMRMEHGHCAALAIRDGRYECTIYERRPSVCRALERSSSSCAAERSEKAARALLAVI